MRTPRVAPSLARPVSGVDQDVVESKAPLELWTTEGVTNNTCMMQVGREPFTRAARTVRGPMALTTVRTGGWLDDITDQVSISSSKHAYVASREAAPGAAELRRAWVAEGVLY